MGYPSPLGAHPSQRTGPGSLGAEIFPATALLIVRGLLEKSLMHVPTIYGEGVSLLTRGRSAQAWLANSRVNWSSKFRLISSSDLPIGGPEGLKTQAHSEQPHPLNVPSSTHTNLRGELPGLLKSIPPSPADM
jgi:hypothetical protein